MPDLMAADETDRSILLTGFPGFIGRRLAAELLERDPATKLVALVEGKMADDAKQAAAELDAERIEVVSGDIGERHLGLADSDWERLSAAVDVVYHLAAIYDLAVPFEAAQRVNVDGTGNVLEFCEACEANGGLDRLNYVSTAYVAGDRHGVVYEHELSLGQGFKNHYESTKFQAELWVEKLRDRVPTTIYRPAIVVGDSKTGRTAKFDGPYYILRMARKLAESHRPMSQIGSGSVPFNVVPVDFVVEAMLAGAAEPTAVDATLHLVDPDPLSTHELFELLTDELTGTKPKLRIPPKIAEFAMRSPQMREAFGNTPRQSIRYLNHSVRFDARQATDLLAKQGLECPRFTDYVSTIVGFYRDHADDPAFA
ncbi:SDR family oxidoreductase [Thermoleophilia bacterium SCSIO 60948]|nr:SDR family oxidoreductase [Thermoleophilia bacterium SCSIO 60948]